MPKRSRTTLFFDESGGGKMPQESISQDDKDRYFIYTAVIANNYDVGNLQRYYFQLKYKHLGGNGELHSSDFFHKSSERKVAFVKAIADFVDSIPFIHITVIVDKKGLFDKTERISPSSPMSTTLRKALSICLEQNISDKDFYNLSIKDTLRRISQYRFPNMRNYYPLEIAYRTILEVYFNDVCPALFKTKQIKPLTELCLETSPNKARILKFTDNFRNMVKEGKRIKLAEDLFQYIYNVSFPFKKARYLGLELADLIGYGYSLEKYKRLSQVPLYRPIRKVVLRRTRVVKKQLGIESVIDI